MTFTDLIPHGLIAGKNDGMTEADSAVIEQFKQDFEVLNDVEKKVNGIFIGADVYGQRPTVSELKPGDSTQVDIEIPSHYFDNLQIAQKQLESVIRVLIQKGSVSIRSVLAQSGLDIRIHSPAEIKMNSNGNYVLPIVLVNHNPHATIQLPQEPFRYLRLFISTIRVEDVELVPIVNELAVNDADKYLLRIAGNEKNYALIEIPNALLRNEQSVGTIRIPIVKTARYNTNVKHINVSQLSSDRKSLDALVGLTDWKPSDTSLSPIPYTEEMLIAETIPIKIPRGYTAIIQTSYIYEGKAMFLHGNSIIIDSEFTGPIRVEFKTSNATKPPEYVDIHIYKNKQQFFTS